MYSYEDRIRAVQLYIKYDRSIADTIRELGYPDRKTLTKWYKEYVENGDLHIVYSREPRFPTFRTLEPHGKIVSAQQGFVRISRTVLYPNIGGRISAGLSQTPRRS